MRYDVIFKYACQTCGTIQTELNPQHPMTCRKCGAQWTYSVGPGLTAVPPPPAAEVTALPSIQGGSDVPTGPNASKPSTISILGGTFARKTVYGIVGGILGAGGAAIITASGGTLPGGIIGQGAHLLLIGLGTGLAGLGAKLLQLSQKP